MSEQPKVLVTRRLPDAVEARLQRDYRALLNTSDAIYSGDRIIELAAGAAAIIPCHTETLNADVIARLPDSVRAICSFSVGYDHIDLAAAKARGIAVTNTPDVLSNATAEIAMLLMLGAARRAHEGAHMLRTDTWADWSAIGQLGIEVTGKRLGIIGMGRVGQVMARRARGFDMQIHYYNRHRLDPGLERGAVLPRRPARPAAAHAIFCRSTARRRRRPTTCSTPSASPRCRTVPWWSTPRAARWSMTMR